MNLVPDVPTVTNSHAQEQTAAGAQLVDVREDHEWDRDHAAGAVHCPLGNVLDQIDSCVDKSQPVLVICKSGGRSARATQALRELGWDAYNVEGGTDEWRESGGPMVTEAQ